MFTSAGHSHSFHTAPAVNAFRHLALSPPDADLDSLHAPPLGADLDMTQAAGHYLGATSERTRFQQPRRTSALSYQNSGARDPRDRSVPRSPKNLVVVIPPSDFPLDQRHLGHVLSMGPRHRLSQGLLMPLFPSMFGQLNAIAREYNFPSIAGLCLYLHVNENGVAMTPRISDDSWQYLFGHLFEARQPVGGQQLPIGGCIEFDIDLNKARWFDTWLSGALRDPEPAFLPVAPSQASVMTHRREESQSFNPPGQPVEDRLDGSVSHTLLANSRPETLRHVPRKLSLVDRLETQSIHIPAKPQNHLDHPSSPPRLETHDLSPIPQSAIPPTAKSDLERRVNSWRVATELYPISMTEAYQPAPDAGVTVGVTTMDEYALEHASRQAVNVDEYHWSVSSMGPRSPLMESPVESARPSSVHLDRRANGSVLLTPTTATSWGPADDDWCSVISIISRLPSPDAGERVVEDIMAPRRSGVWGNSFGWRSAMTWREVYPYSAPQTKIMIRVHLQDSDAFVAQYPNLVIYPTVGSHLDMDSLPDALKHPELCSQPVYPYSKVAMESVTPIQLYGAGGLVPKYPRFCIYPAVYPYSEIYPACGAKDDLSQPVSVTLGGSSNFITSYPTLVIYPAVYPHLDIYPPVVEGAKMKVAQVDANMRFLDSVSALYPNLVIYPAVYPYFDLYPIALQITKTLKQKETDVGLVNAGCLAAEYPNVIIYPNAYPYLEIYPRCDTRRRASSATWGISFGWLTAKTWLQVYPLHTASSLARRQNSAITDITAGKQSVWGSSFGWKGAKTWHATWPISHAQIPPSTGPIPVQQGSSSVNYPYLIIYPATYPHFDIYPSRATTAEDSQTTKENQCSIDLIAYYPNLIIYPAVYPHFDVYPAMARASDAAERGKGLSNLRRRRIEMWRAKTAAQVGLIELLANNHNWEVDEPLQLNLADYAWSQTSVGPATSPLDLPHTQSISGSVHMDRRGRGSVALTPSTATTWGPQDDDWYSDISNIERLPSPDLGQRILDDVENAQFPHQPWRMVWPFFENESKVKTLPSIPASVSQYSHLVIYPPVYPHFELYPTWNDVSTLNSQVTETLTVSNTYPVLDIYPAVYPQFNIYPAHLRIETASKVVSNVRQEQVEVKLPSLYPNFDIYHACYPYNLYHIYPFTNAIKLTQIPVEASTGYPWLVIYPSVYPYIIPYPGSSAEIGQLYKPELSHVLPPSERKPLSVKLPVRYPTLELYSAGYPWSLESIYPAISVDDRSGVTGPHYPHILIYPNVYPFVQPYPTGSVHIPGTLDEGEYESVKAFLASSELKHTDPKSPAYPHFSLYPAPTPVSRQGRVVQNTGAGEVVTPPLRKPIVKQRKRKTHVELHTTIFRSVGKGPAQNAKTHVQLHAEVFQDDIVWTPSGYTQDLDPSFLSPKKWKGTMPASQHRPPLDQAQESSTLRASHSRSGTTAAQSPDEIVLPLGQPPAVPSINSPRVRSPGVPSQPSLAVSASPVPRVSLPPSPDTHLRSSSSRLSQAMKSMMPGNHRRSLSASPGSPPPEDHKERVRDFQQSPTKFLSWVDRRPTTVPLSHPSVSEFPTRTTQSLQRKDSLVLQRARAYEQSTSVHLSSGTIGTKGMHSSFALSSSPPLLPVTASGGDDHKI